MSLTMYSASVPIFLRTLGHIGKWLDKAEAHAQAKKFDIGVLLGTRLSPDMLPFTRQVQMTSDAAKFGAARLAGIESPKFDDVETTLPELRERIAKTVAFLESIPAEKIDGSDDRDVTIPRRDGPLTLKGEVYLRTFVLPNFYFHTNMIYALLRHNGVELGKSDYLGPLGA